MATTLTVADRRRARRSSGPQFPRPGWRPRTPSRTAAPRRCSSRSPCAAAAARPCAAGHRGDRAPRARSRCQGRSRRRRTGPRRSPRRTSSRCRRSRRRSPGRRRRWHGGERVDDPVGADLARVVHQDRDAGADTGLDHDAGHVAEVPRRACRATRAAPPAPWSRPRSRRRRRSRATRAVRAAATAHSSAVRRSSVATRQSAVTSPSLTRPEHGVAVADVGGEERHRLSRREVQAEVEDLDRVGQRADRDEVDAGLGHLARPLEGEAAGGLERRPDPR